MLKDEVLLVGARGFKPRTWKQVLDNLMNKRRVIDPIIGCWIDTGAKSKKGYTTVRFNRRNIRTARFIWEIYSECEISDGKMICHTCDNPPCFNFAHLFLGTNTDNQHDMIAKGRARHPSGDSLATKLTSEIVKKMRIEYANGGISFRELGLKYGISKSLARETIARIKWKCVE